MASGFFAVMLQDSSPVLGASCASRSSSRQQCRAFGRSDESITARTRCSIWWPTSSAIHEFVPLCQRHTIRITQEMRRQRDPDDRHDGQLSRSFATRIGAASRSTGSNGRILVESVDGPLRRLRTLWTFQARGDDSCDVGFDLSYEFASPMIGLLVGGIFDAAFSRFVQAFERRADAIYGRRQRSSCLRPQVLKSSDARITDADPSPRQLYPVKVGASPFATDRIDAALDLNQ